MLPDGPQEIINHGKDGFLVPMNDKTTFLARMDQLASDDALFYAMSEKTKQTALKFDGNQIKQSWLELGCNSVLEKRPCDVPQGHCHGDNPALLTTGNDA